MRTVQTFSNACGWGSFTVPGSFTTVEWEMRDAVPKVQDIKVWLPHGTFQVIHCFDFVLLEPHKHLVEVGRETLSQLTNPGRLKCRAHVRPEAPSLMLEAEVARWHQVLAAHSHAASYPCAERCALILVPPSDPLERLRNQSNKDPPLSPLRLSVSSHLGRCIRHPSSLYPTPILDNKYFNGSF